MQPICQHSQLHAVAQQLVRISSVAAEIYQDQMDLVGHFTAQNLFRIDPLQHRVELLNGLFSLEFYPPKSHTNLIETHFEFAGKQQEAFEDFFLHDLHFLTGDLKPQHSLFLRNQAQQLRQLILQQVYLWADGAARVQQLLLHLDGVQAQILDQALIQSDYAQHAVFTGAVQHGAVIPDETLTALSALCALEFIEGDTFLPVQALMHSYDEFCFSLSRFVPAGIYRILELRFPERVSLHEIEDSHDDLQLLYRHAIEQSHLLGFVRIMNRAVWAEDNILAKRHFLEKNTRIWQTKVARLPLFDYPRAVNWLFRQSKLVLDWLSDNIHHSSVRVAVVALSFVDCSQIHPRIILATLQYFQYASARLFIQSCDHFALQHQWFEHQHNSRVVQKGQRQSLEDPRISISPSILYLDEWMNLLAIVAAQDELQVKQVYARLSRVMQAYMLHLHKVTAELPAELIQFIHPESQQSRDFMYCLRRHQLTLEQFRQLFYLKAGPVRESVFDAYVRDYLVDYFNEKNYTPKNVSWSSIFQRAVRWHQEVHKAEILAKLKKQLNVSHWPPVSLQGRTQYLGWCFEELNSLDRIIQESRSFHHCLAVSYSQKIIEGEYVAFHMSSPCYRQSLTLGCHLLDGQLRFDQLEYPNNHKAEQLLVNIAEQFIQWLNSRLKQDPSAGTL
ncbi:hypothetical protein MUB05_08385 [Acinetobacter indicus]|uniref:hypothetical protein n=1 Tax=Acinetobacter TaxID=469 RepID=UPI0015D3C73A|nr:MULTISPECIES: hypothetical protein [Acinetobacter]MCP0916610.1 hypothetical protein [Acinetobacter indicus]MCP0919723.1 hypothetical protein [Acinetobacter indicus]MCP0922390.1 hypothetical protein [Acinetobacter indicus]